MHLLIMACSAKKKNTSKEIPAINLYDGVFYGVLRNSFKEHPSLKKHTKILIISAKYGLIEADKPISQYELKMTPEIATQQRELNSKLLREYLYKINPESIMVALGSIYMGSIDFSGINLPITFIEGEGIGYMLGDFKTKLNKLSSDISKTSGWFAKS